MAVDSFYQELSYEEIEQNVAFEFLILSIVEITL